MTIAKKRLAASLALFAALIVAVVIAALNMEVGSGRSAVELVDYSGRTVGNETALAVSMQGGKAVGYLCDGKRTGMWFSGPAAPDGRLELASSDGSHLTGKATKGHVVGDARLFGGRILAFDLPEAGTSGVMYRATGQAAGKSVDVGWAILPDGSQAGIVNRNGVRSPAPRLGAVRTITIDGIAMPVMRVTGRFPSGPVKEPAPGPTRPGAPSGPVKEPAPGPTRPGAPSGPVKEPAPGPTRPGAPSGPVKEPAPGPTGAVRLSGGLLR
ncbi:hypothetical protein [Streptomyces sp. NPDC057909]|uniref:hypothetical protein n=1 Tax=Streptomyces sp. NPDC057909 TaxID=3346277 RepID=UPI0036EDA765